MYKLLLILIGSYLCYFFTHNIKLMICLFILLIVLLLWETSRGIARKEQEVSQARGNIDDAFQKRHDILVKLFESTKGFVQYKENELKRIGEMEKGILNPLSENILQDKLELQNSVKRILLNSITQLKNDQVSTQFEILNRSINDVEENLSASRRFYNHAVKEYNSCISSFPSSIIAKKRFLSQAAYFEVSDSNVRKDVEIKF